MGVEDTASVFSHVTNPEFSISDRTMMITEKARDPAIPQSFVEKRFFESHVGLPHLVQKSSTSQCLRVKENIIIPQLHDYFAWTSYGLSNSSVRFGCGWPRRRGIPFSVSRASRLEAPLCPCLPVGGKLQFLALKKKKFVL